MKRSRLLTILTTAILILILGSVACNAETVASGECGDSVKWEIGDDRVLVISGNGRTADYQPGASPLDLYINDFDHVIIGEGISGLGSNLFGRAFSPISITLPDSVTDISDDVLTDNQGFVLFCKQDSAALKFAENKGLPHLVNGKDDLTEFGSCGNEGTGVNVIWTMDREGTMDLYGKSETEGYTVYNSSSESPFSRNKRIKKLIVHEGITSIGQGLFTGCSEIAEIELPDTLTFIGLGAFDSSGALKSIDIPKSVTELDSDAFYDCSALESIKIHNNLTKIGMSAFHGTKWFKDQPQGLVYIGKILYGYSGKYPSSLTIRKGTTAIACGAFDACSKLKSIKIPSSMRYIGEYAFEGCNIKTLKIPNGVKKIDQGAFAGNYRLKSIVVPKSVTYIGLHAFDSCNIRSVKILNKSVLLAYDSIGANPVIDGKPYGPVYASNKAVEFNYYKTKPSAATFKKGTTSIAALFAKWAPISSLTIPASVKMIGDNPFVYCSKLKSITVNKKNNKYDSRNNCNAIIQKNNNKLITGCKNTVIPASVTNIGIGAFAGCTGLKTIKIPKKVKIIDHEAFIECTSLKSISIPARTETIEFEAFYGCKSLSSVTLAKGVKTIGSKAFSNCPKLKTVTIPASVTRIDKYALGYKESGRYGTYKIKKISGFTICGQKGTAAEKYAQENGFRFVIVN